MTRGIVESSSARGTPMCTGRRRSIRSKHRRAARDRISEGGRTSQTSGEYPHS